MYHYLFLLTALFFFNQPLSAQISADSLWSFESIRTDLNGDGEPDFLGENVTISGVVNVDSGLFHEHYLQIFVQNDTTGMSVFAMETLTPVLEGDSLIVYGKIDRYFGMTEVHADSYRVVKQDVEIPIYTLESAIQNPAQYLGMKIEGAGRIVDKGRTFNGKYIHVKPRGIDESMMVYVSNFHRLFSDFNFDVLSVGDEISVKGVITEYNPEFPDRQVFKLFLRTPDDLKYRSIPKYYIIMILIVLGIGITFIGAWTLILRLRVKSKTTKIQATLDQKEILLKEVHHRVKNSLSIVSGLVELQRSNTENAEAVAILHDTQSRIQSIALIHDKIYKTDSLSEIRLDDYIRELVTSIHNAFSDKAEKVSLNFDVDPITLDTGRTIYCGLLTSEIVVNALKHAFNDTGRGTISVTIKRENGWINLTISDNGSGLPKDFEAGSTENLGTLLINSFASHLNAEMDKSTSKGDGTTFFFSFPMKK